MNGEAISETDWGSFQSLKERKTKRLRLLEVGISIKEHRDQIGRNLWRGTLPGSDTRLLDFFRIYSLVSIQRLM